MGCGCNEGISHVWGEIIKFLWGLQLKSDRELDKIKGLKLGELWLERNPLSNNYKDQASYIRSVRPRSVSGTGGVYVKGVTEG